MAEFDLGLEIVPADNLRERCDTEAILLGDLQTILVDKRSFTNPKQEYRLRFSVAPRTNSAWPRASAFRMNVRVF